MEWKQRSFSGQGFVNGLIICNIGSRARLRDSVGCLWNVLSFFGCMETRSCAREKKRLREMNQEEVQLKSHVFKDSRDQSPEDISESQFEETLKEIEPYILKAETARDDCSIFHCGQQMDDMHCIIASQNNKMQRMTSNLERKFHQLNHVSKEAEFLKMNSLLLRII